MLPSHLSFIECLYLVLSMPVFFVVSCSYRSLLIKFMEPSYASIDYGRLEQSLIVFLLRLVKYRYRSMFVIAISFSHFIFILSLDVPLCSLLCVTIWTGILAALPVLISVVNWYHSRVILLCIRIAFSMALEALAIAYVLVCIQDSFITMECDKF